MQTLKTAAIVVLLMTVVYSAYISLTTPPESLPANVQQLVFEDDSMLDFDPGLPESLGELGINAAKPEDTAAQLDPEPPAASAGVPPIDTGVEMDAPPSLAGATSDPPAATGFQPPPPDAPSPPTLDSNTDSSIAFSMNDQPPIDAETVNAATEIAAAAPPELNFPEPPVEAKPETPRQYPRTNSTFELPDPTAVNAEYESKGPAEQRPPNSTAEEAAELALTSGTLDRANHSTQTSAARDASATTASTNLGLANAIRTADEQYAKDRRKDALATLSLFYNTPNLSGEQRAEMLSRLDPLAREVIYSRKHMLESPYRVGGRETLVDIAAKYEVPWELLANINQIRDPVTVLPGTELKVVRGPFRAQINLTTKEMTLFLGDLYAGRFPIGIGEDPIPQPGWYTVQDKQTARTYYDHSGAPIPPGSPNNPYGDAWLDLGGELCIHGSPSTTEPTLKGCISLAADHAADLYGILSLGSTVMIRR